MMGDRVNIHGIEPRNREEFIPAPGRNVVYAFRNPAYWLSTPEGLAKRPGIHEDVAPFVYRPAQIVRVWSLTGPKTCNLVVFIDGSNDRALISSAHLTPDQTPLVWKTSVVLGPVVPDSHEHYLPRVPEGAPLA